MWRTLWALAAASALAPAPRPRGGALRATPLDAPPLAREIVLISGFESFNVPLRAFRVV